MTIEQGRINQFADATGDHQCIHVVLERAKDGPFGAPIAHGFLTLSLPPEFSNAAYRVKESRTGVNYGLDKVRFPAPVPVHSKLRSHFKLLSYEALEGGGAQTKVEMIVERDGGTKPVCIAESITRRYP
ncbi:MaoC family dehydratase [Cupriavidus sp. KK10]|uniref:MaoC family dehydratase n=1 Tax=Cupriavidus sp. KK10 TaxID=1478019 RepID=UPI00273A3B89|nr:MaoC family dehydratase [Cupriavidus sp. KK10]